MRKMIRLKLIFVIFYFLMAVPVFTYGQISLREVSEQIESLQNNDQDLEHWLDILEKKVDDLIWFERVGDVAFIDKVYLTGPPLWKEENPTAPGAGNPVKFWAYVFLSIRGLPGAEFMASGVLLSILAAGLQVRKSNSFILIWKFDHNGVYHIVQTLGLFLLIAGLLEMTIF